jgi:hypothetical protein
LVNPYINGIAKESTIVRLRGDDMFFEKKGVL